MQDILLNSNSMSTVRILFAFFIFVYISATIAPALLLRSDIIKREFYTAFELYSVNKTSNIEELLQKINNPAISLIDIPNTPKPVNCLRCRTFVYTFLKYLDRLRRRNENVALTPILKSLCIMLTILSPKACDGYANLYRPTIDYILRHQQPHRRHADYDEGVCAILFQSSQCATAGYTIPMDLSIDVELAASRTAKQYSRNDDRHNITILHLTDFHYDPLYSPGSTTRCAETCCCRTTSTPLPPIDGQYSATGAGYWGELGACDTPGYLIEKTCQQIGRQHPNIDYVYYTGDFVDHFEWQTSKQWVMDSVVFGTEVMRRAFAVGVIPVIGNHDIHPANGFAPPSVTDPELRIDWLKNFLADQWSDWLTVDAAHSLRKHGYYSMLLRPDWRVIVLNSNVCYERNLWLLHETESLRQQLAWLYRMLLDAEQAGEYVHLLGHVPTNNASLAAWNSEYERIIGRFAHIIAGQFNGHTHRDEFSIVHAEDGDNPSMRIALGEEWTGGGVTAFGGLNSNYRLYQVDSQNYNVLDHETWIFNLTEANDVAAHDRDGRTPPRWFKEYSFRNEYNVASLSPAVLSRAAITQWTQNTTTLPTIWRNKVKHSDKMLAAGCNDACLCTLFRGIMRYP